MSQKYTKQKLIELLFFLTNFQRLSQKHKIECYALHFNIAMLNFAIYFLVFFSNSKSNFTFECVQ